MIIKRIPFRYPIDPPRTGVHLSDIIKDILKIKDPKTYGHPITRASHDTFQKGYAWEDYLQSRSVWPKFVLLQQVFVLDNIINTLDGFSLEEECVYESKATFISAGRPITHSKFVHWKWQLMGYCKAARVNKARLDILFLNGNYRPLRPVPRSYLWTFRERELDGNWSMVTRHRDRMMREGRLPEA